MLRVAEYKLKEFANKEFVEADIANFDPKDRFDICVGVLSIHHLAREEKQKLSKKVYNFLNKEGLFIIGDLIIGKNKEETEMIENEWKMHLTNKFGKRGAESWMKLYKKEDIPESVEDQLKWLTDAGFEEFGLVWRKRNLAVIYGKKLG